MNNHPFGRIFFLLFLTFFFSISSVNAQGSRKKREDNKTRASRNLTEAEYYFTEGMKFYITDDFVKAISLFERSLQLAPDNSGANYILADALTKKGDFSRAISYAEKALKLDDTNKYYYLLLAQLYEKERRYQQASKVYLELLKKRPDDIEAYFDLASIYIYQGKYDDAIRAYEKVEKTYGINEEITRQKQQIYLKQNKLDEAIREGQKLVKEQPGETGPVISLAELLISNNRAEQAQPLLEEIVATNPENAQARLVLSDIYRGRGDLQKSEKQLEVALGNPNLDEETKVTILASYVSRLAEKDSKANALRIAETMVKQHPTNAKVFAIYGDLLLASGEKAHSRDMYAKAAHLDQAMFEVWERVIRLDADLNQIDSMILHADQALEVFPNQATLWYFSGAGHLTKKEYQKAADALEAGKKLVGSNTQLLNDFNAQLGDVYNGIGNNALSDEAYEAVLLNDPDNAYVLNNYSYYLSLRKDKLNRAREMAARLIGKHPDNANYLDTYAWVLYVSKDYQEAIKYLEKAANQNSSNGTILEHYGDALFKLGQTDKALEQWKKAKKLGEASGILDKKITTGKLYE